jgi:hypothetical protein
MKRLTLFVFTVLLFASSVLAGSAYNAWYDYRNHRVCVTVGYTGLIGDTQRVPVKVVYEISPNTGSFGATVRVDTKERTSTVFVQPDQEVPVYFDIPDAPNWGYESYTVKWTAYVQTWHGWQRVDTGRFSIWD